MDIEKVEIKEKKIPLRTRKILKQVLSAVLMVIFIITAVLEFLTLTEYRPDMTEEVAVNYFSYEALSPGDSLKVLTWNVGYGALGDNADYFKNGGKSVRTADEERVQRNLKGIIKETSVMRPDVIFFQEVDRDSSRSYHIDETIAMINELSEEYTLRYTTAFAYNYNVNYVPYPIPPIGEVRSGLLTLTTMPMESAQRIQLPCPFDWPDRLIDYKRCLLLERLPLQNSDKELVLVNLHMEAFASSKAKENQTGRLMQILEEEAAKGNYVIAGGDFDQTFSGTDTSAYPQQEGKWAPGEILTEELGDSWQCLMDSSAPTCRSLDRPYEGADHGSFQYYVVDGCILSSNIEVRSFETKDLGFVYTDHNPVLLECVLKQGDM